MNYMYFVAPDVFLLPVELNKIRVVVVDDEQCSKSFYKLNGPI